ncbi:MAG: T9SS type A sorting domain-containing protein [Bacteroides sp.]
MRPSQSFLLISLLLFPFFAHSQEKTAKVTLPFFDDFSYSHTTPLPAYWEQGSDATITRARAIDAPTPGVLTLDAARADGLLHRNATPAVFPAETLVSHPITIETGQDSLYLSFRFQPGGWVEAPARGDSLMVDFFDPVKREWVNVWGALFFAQQGRLEQFFRHTPRWETHLVQKHERAQQHFFLAHIPLRERRFVHDGFQFRFRNLASLVHDNTAPGRTANSSQWHIDMVYLNAQRAYNDTIVPDVACTRGVKTLFAEYSAVPAAAFEEYLKLRDAEASDSLGVYYANFGVRTYNVRRLFEIKDLKDKVRPQQYSGGNLNIAPRASIAYQRTISYPWEELATGEAIEVKIRAFLQTDNAAKNAPFRWNDTVETLLRCTNEYAYDLGEPSSGYGVIGVGADRAAVSMRFRPLKPTAIQAVRLWFQPIADLRSRKRFRLSFWEDVDGVPGKKVYEQMVTPPYTEGEVGRFYEVQLTTPINFSRPYHVGWEQTSADMLGIGYDASTPYKATIHTRTTAQWTKSKLSGALLIRLVCGGTGTDPELPAPTGSCGIAVPHSVVYPNPAQERVMLQTEEEVAELSLYNLQGIRIRSGWEANRPESVEGLPAGLYLLRITYRTGVQDVKKLFVAR